MAKNKVQIDLTAVDKTRAAFKSVNSSISRTKQSVSGMTVAFQALAGAFAVRRVVGVVTGFEKLNASLVTVTGTTEGAAKAMADIQAFASSMPFAINEVTDSFIKLKAFGLDPSNEALEAYANTASAMGKSLNQVIEAVADAATGEFERLKEFGIKAKTQGDNVIFTFRNVATTVRKSATDIEDYIKNIGLNEFAGAASLQVDTLGGSLVNLADSVAIAVNKFAGDSGLVAWLKETSLAITDIINFNTQGVSKLSEIGKVLGDLSDRRASLREELKSTGDQDVWAGLYRQLQDVNLQIDVNKNKWDELIAKQAEAGQGNVPALPAPAPLATTSKSSSSNIKDDQDLLLDIYIREEEALRRINAEIDAGVRLTAAQTEELQKQASARSVAIEKQEAARIESQKALDSQKAFADNVASTMTSAFEDAIFQAGSLKDIFAGLLEDIARMIIRQTILRNISSTISGYIPAFASGTSFAPGGAALVGERGPEIVNLPRGSSVIPNNKIGSAAVNVVVNNNTGTNADAQVEEQPDGTILINLIESVVSQSVNNNGTVGRSMQNRFGLQVQGVTR